MELILVIDDDEALRNGLRLALLRVGYRVVVARDGREGLDLFQQVSPDLVITDIVMDEKEGLETIRALKRAVPDVKIMAMSGGGTFKDGSYLEAAKCLGAQQTLDKPFDLKHFLLTVEEVLHPGRYPK